MPQLSNCRELAEQASRKYNLPPGLLYSLIQFESGCQPDVVSPKGAIGIAQIVPKYHPNVDPRDPAASIDYAGGLIKHAYDRFGSYALAVASYHSGEKAVADAGGIPGTNDGLTTTKNYVKAILSAAGLIDDSGVSKGNGTLPNNNPKTLPGILNPNNIDPGKVTVPDFSKPGYPLNPATTKIDPEKRKLLILSVGALLLMVAMFRLK